MVGVLIEQRAIRRNDPTPPCRTQGVLGVYDSQSILARQQPQIAFNDSVLSERLGSRNRNYFRIEVASPRHRKGVGDGIRISGDCQHCTR